MRVLGRLKGRALRGLWEPQKAVRNDTTGGVLREGEAELTRQTRTRSVWHILVHGRVHTAGTEESYSGCGMWGGLEEEETTGRETELP